MLIETKLNDQKIISAVLGIKDFNLNILKEYFNIEIAFVSDSFECKTNDKKIVEKVNNIILTLAKLAKNNINFSYRDVIFIIEALEKNNANEITDLFMHSEVIVKTKQGNNIIAKSFNQKRYLEAMQKNVLIFGVGPAGTGKTYLPVAYAASLLKKGEIKKIILTRPAVETGESLGFLPGDLKEKVDPYLRPLYDALYEFFGKDLVDNYIKQEIIEIAPLAYMRGRTLDKAFVILDEAQNTTYAQMKMFLTRLGFNSKIVITGDITQIDLPKGIRSGLKEAVHILKEEKKIKIVEFEKLDVVRHPLVKKIIYLFEKYESKNN